MSQGFNNGRDMRITTSARDGSRDFYGHDDRSGQGGDRRGGRGRGRGGGGRGGGGNYDTRDRGGGRGGGGGGYDSRDRDGGSYRERDGGDRWQRGGGNSGNSSRDGGGGRWQRGGGRGRRGGKTKGSGGRRDDGGPSPLSRLNDEDGDVSMGDEDSSRDRNRFNPYGDRSGRDKRKGPRGRRDNGGPSNRGSSGGGGLFRQALDSAVPSRSKNYQSRDKREPKNRSRDRQRDSHETWYKVMIPYGKKHDKDWLLTAIRNMCTVPFQVIDYHYVSNTSAFYIDDKTAADAIQSVSNRITAKTGHKIIITTKPSRPPAGHTPKFTFDENTVQLLKETMSKRYDPSTKQLNLSNLFHDDDMKNIVAVNKPAHMREVIKVIAENIPEIFLLNLSRNKLYNLQTLSDLVGKAPDLKILDISDNMLKTDQELDLIKGFKLEELMLRSNPFCKDYRDSAELVSAVRKRFPKLLKLDGNELPPPIAFAIEEITTLPPIQRSFMVSEEIERVLTKFIEHYYAVFDSTNRQTLLEAYHEQARFSLTASTSGSAPAHVRSLFQPYTRNSRNLLKVGDGSQRLRLMKQGKLSTVAFLNELPEMQHDTSSFQVDVSRAEPNILAFTVHGVFKNVENKNNDHPLLAFSRFFVTVPNPATGCLIVNDELCLRQPTSQQKRTAFSSAAPTPSSSPVTVPTGSPAPAPGLTAEQQAMVKQFIADSQMNTEWSLKCLQENNWDYPAAGTVFMQLKESGSIPAEAFVK